MSPEKRREQILSYLKDRKNATSIDLSREFGVTEETIRKDLNSLSSEGMLIRTFGGAILKEEFDPPLVQRNITNYDEKISIAKIAASFISSNDCIALDAGSTTIELARQINPDFETVVITNSLEIMNILSKTEGISLICTGGTLRARSMSFQGSLAARAFSSFNIGKAFISAKGISPEIGVMDTNEQEAEVKRLIIDSAREVTLLADHTKFNRLTHITVCGIEKLTRIITDSKTDETMLEKYRELGIEVVIAP